MASLDQYLSAMTKHKAQSLVLRASAPIAMVLAGKEKPVSSKSASKDQILKLLTEVLGTAYAPGRMPRGEYPYGSPSGPVTIEIDETSGLVVRIHPGTGKVPRKAAGGTPAAPPALKSSSIELPTPEPMTFEPTLEPATPPPRAAKPAAGKPAGRKTAPPAPSISLTGGASEFELAASDGDLTDDLSGIELGPQSEPISLSEPAAQTFDYGTGWEAGAPATAPMAAPAQAAPMVPSPMIATHTLQGVGGVPAMPSAPRQLPNLGVAPYGIDDLFNQMLDAGASDLHLKSNGVPMIRVDGAIAPLPRRAPLSNGQLTAIVNSVMPERNREQYIDTNDTDFAYEMSRARMRCNVFRDLTGIGAVFRQIPTKVLTAEQLGLPKVVIDMCGNTKGLVVVTGPTGSGKSTTLAGMIDWINKNRTDHIITIEDPVEFVHKDIKCLINQREVGVHTKGFKNALRAALREDPDIVLVGEMRDLETVAIAIETAETGHLVFGTLHTNTAPSTVDRLIDQFPTDQQEQIRIMLSESLRGVVAQTLLKKKGGGRVAALEILVVTPAISNLIREAKTFQIPSMMQTGRGIGMITLNDAMLDLVKKGIVEPLEAYAKAPKKSEFGHMLKVAGFQGPWMNPKDE